jgi:hypothetical protein
VIRLLSTTDIYEKSAVVERHVVYLRKSIRLRIEKFEESATIYQVIVPSQYTGEEAVDAGIEIDW